ncbi:MAG TPA: hypothetical protein VFQ06_12790, partial [Nitrospira sp.]|nr:hypothetical protein [Nitrospira sp.]
MIIFFERGGALLIALGLLCFGAASTTASAAGSPPQLDPSLSLTGDCSTSTIDPVPDPDCPYPSPPVGPSGRFDEPRSIAIDVYGNEYVASYAGDGAKGRIDVFDDKGNFITELLDPHGPQSVAVDSKGNLYVYERVPGTQAEIARYSPSIYEPIAGKIEYKNSREVIAGSSVGEVIPFRGGLAIDVSNDRLFVAEEGQIGEYSSAGEGNKKLAT